MLVRQRGRSKASGVPVDMRLGQVWTFEGEQAIRMEMYASHEEALEAVVPIRATSLPHAAGETA